MSESILTSTKKILGIDESYTVFDPDIVIHINSVFSVLQQLGIGPEQGYSITDKIPTWAAFLGADSRLNSVKTYMYLRVRMLFDPPTTAHLIAAMQEQVRELEWRLNVTREGDSWVDPDPGILDGSIPVGFNLSVLDGGAP